MADEGYWRAKAHRPAKPELKIGARVLAAVAALGLGVALAEVGPPFFPTSDSGWVIGDSTASIVFAAVVLGLLAALGGWALLEAVARLSGRARPAMSVFLFLIPAGAAGAVACAFLLPGPLDDKLTDARVTASWGHYVETLQFDETHLSQEMAKLALSELMEPRMLARPRPWEAVRQGVREGRAVVAKYRGYEIYRRDEALKLVDTGSLRPSARAKARKRILDGYAVMAPLFASRWDIIDAHMLLREKFADLLERSPKGWRITAQGLEVSDPALAAALDRVIARSRELSAQEDHVVCQLNKNLSLPTRNCELFEELLPGGPTGE